MKIRLFFALLSVSFFSFWIPQISYAADYYVVKPIILVPNDWKDKITQGDIERYKNGVIFNLNSVKQFYASKGAIFNFDLSVDVAYSPKELIESANKRLDDQVNSLNSPEASTTERGKIKAVWVVGTQIVAGMYAYSYGSELNGEGGRAIMPYEDLLAANGEGTLFQRQFSKLTLAHELGHAFGATESNWANGHPCTEVSKQMCKGDITKYPPAIEWASVMGYAANAMAFPDSFLNNSVVNPDMWTICHSPFIKCPSIPEPTESKTNVIAITGFSPNTIIAGQTVEIHGSGFDQINRFRLEKMPERKEAASTEDKLKILSKTDGRAVLQIPEDLILPNTEGEWTVWGAGAGTNNKFSQLNYGNRLVIRDNELKSITFDGKITLTCGSGKNPVPDRLVYLLNEDNDKVLTASTTDENGVASLVYTFDKTARSSKYNLIPSSLKPGLSAQTENGDTLVTIAIPNPPSDFTNSFSFNYSSCPTEATASPSPLPTPTPIPSTSSGQGGDDLTGWGSGNSNSTTPTQITKLQISNYADFRENNTPGDVGSPTETIEKPSDPNARAEGCPDTTVCVEWALSTLSSDTKKPIYFREFIGNEPKGNGWMILISDQEIVQMPFGDQKFTITGSIPNKTIAVTLQLPEENQNIYPQGGELNLADLGGKEGLAKEFTISYERRTAKGNKPDVFEINYSPDTPSPTASNTAIKGFYCSGNQMMKKNSDNTVSYNCTCGNIAENSQDCGTDPNKTVCQDKTQNEANAAGLESDATCAEPTTQPTPTPTSSPSSLPKTIRGWYCLGNQIIEQYTDQSASSYCTCGDGSQRCDGDTSKTICENISSSDPQYEFDARCVAPSPTPIPTPTPSPTSKPIRGWYCLGNQIIEQYTDQSASTYCTCGDGSEGCGGDPNKTVCENISSVYPQYKFDAQCVPPATPPPPPPPPAKRLTGWWCVNDNEMYRQYSDGTREYNCTCGNMNEHSQDCGTDEEDSSKTVCKNKEQWRVPASYDVDAECVAP